MLTKLDHFRPEYGHRSFYDPNNLAKILSFHQFCASFIWAESWHEANCEVTDHDKEFLPDRFNDYLVPLHKLDKGNSFLTEDLREKVKAVLLQRTLSNAFGDGFEEQYIMEGTTFVGLNNMSDKDLVDQLAEDEGNVRLLKQCMELLP